MTILSRQVDEWIVIGEKLTLSPTDIDASGVRIVVRGHLIGGAEDGLAVDRAHELAIGSSIRLGELVTVTLMKIGHGDDAKPAPTAPAAPRAVFGIQAPPNLTIHRKELSNPSGGGGGPRPAGEGDDPSAEERG